MVLYQRQRRTVGSRDAEVVSAGHEILFEAGIPQACAGVRVGDPNLTGEQADVDSARRTEAGDNRLQRVSAFAGRVRVVGVSEDHHPVVTGVRHVKPAAGVCRYVPRRGHDGIVDHGRFPDYIEVRLSEHHGGRLPLGCSEVAVGHWEVEHAIELHIRDQQSVDAG